jgi:hypothetical protein
VTLAIPPRSIGVRASRPRLAPALALAAALLTWGCQGKGPGVDVSLSLDPGPANSALSRLTVVSGGDKYEFQSLQPGESRKVRLLPGEGDRQVTLLYMAGAERRTWESPALQAGRAHEVVLHIGPDGRVRSASVCQAPCKAPVPVTPSS